VSTTPAAAAAVRAQPDHIRRNWQLRTFDPGLAVAI